MDCVVIQNGMAHQVIANTTRDALWLKVHDGESAPRLIVTQAIYDATVEVESGNVVEGATWDGESFTNPPAPAGPSLAEYAAAARYAIETGGLTFGGMTVATDRESQAMLAGAFAYTTQNPQATIQWKAENAFVALDAATIAALANAVGAHVQACFAKEAEVVAAIEGGTITTAVEIVAAFEGI